MRDILFKAKAINRDDDNGCYRTSYKNGDWVYGLVTKLFDDRFENCPAAMKNTDGVSGIEVDHNTICQYTGQNDRHYYKIFENDIVRTIVDDMTMLVRWDNENSKYVLDDYSSDGILMDTYEFGDFLNRDLEIIGNVFDNRNLIGPLPDDEISRLFDKLYLEYKD